MELKIWKKFKRKLKNTNGPVLPPSGESRRRTPMSNTSLTKESLTNFTLDEIKRTSKQRWQDAHRKSELMKNTCELQLAFKYKHICILSKAVAKS